MKISVIIPAYKARKFLPETLDSIGRQTYTPMEIIVVDDCSPDPVDDIIAEFDSRPDFPTIRLLKHNVNQGQAAARNTGMAIAKGDWFAFLDSDDVWAANHLQQLVHTAESEDADLVFCPANVFYNESELSNWIERPITLKESVFDPLSLLLRCFIITSSTLIKRVVIEKIGGFDPNPQVRGVEDLDCFLKLLRINARFIMADNATLYYRKHSGSATETPGYLIRQYVFVAERHLKWIQMSKRRKKLILAKTLWRAAIQTLVTNASDRYNYLHRAIISSYPFPLRCTFWLLIYSKKWMKIKFSMSNRA